MCLCPPSLIKDFKLPDDSTYSGRLITYPAPFVSFLRIGRHSMSKSETLNGIINNPESDNISWPQLSWWKEETNFSKWPCGD